MHATNSWQVLYGIWSIYLLFWNKTTMYITYISMRPIYLLQSKTLLQEMRCSRLYAIYCGNMASCRFSGSHNLKFFREIMWREYWLTYKLTGSLYKCTIYLVIINPCDSLQLVWSLFSDHQVHSICGKIEYLGF